MDPVFSETLRIALVLLFASAAIHKIRHRTAFRSALAQYQILPEALVVPAACGLVLAETISAGLLVNPATSLVGALCAGSILFVYTAAIAFNLARGRRDIDCGCGGVLGPKQLGTSLLWRNGLLLLACAFLTLPESLRPLLWLDRFTIGAAVATLALAGHAASLLADSRQHSIQQRIS
ncbi:MAG: MauE/DoxX family redox-associated membrane protein [Myxococcota bacterium]